MAFPTRSPVVLPAESDALTYEPYFGLSEKPFSLNSGLRFLYDSPSHAASLQHLLDGTRRREGLLVLTGEIGMGKTMLCRAVLEKLGKTTFSSFVPDPFISHEDLLKRLLIDFGVISIGDLTSGSLKGSSRTELSYLLSGFLSSLASIDAYVVVIIDEAQNMSGSMIEATRILSDSFDARGRLQIVLVGQLELHERLKSPEMRQVDQRITSYTRLEPLSHDAVAGYIQHRIVVAGGSSSRIPFTPDVVEIVHRRTGGVPRLVNRVCDRALQTAYERQIAVVDRTCLDAALSSIGSTTFTPTWASIVFAETSNADRSAAAPAPTQSAPTPVTRRPAPVAQIDVERSDRSVTSPQEITPEESTETASRLADDSNFLALLDEAFSNPPESMHEGVEFREQSPVAVRPAAVETHRESSADVQKMQVPQQRRPPLTPSPAPAAFAESPERVWPKRLGIALGFAAFCAIAVVVYQWPTVAARFRQAPPPVAALDAPPVETNTPEPVSPPVAEPVAAASADYFVAVGLYANRAFAATVVETLIGAGLPALQRPIEVRGEALEQVVVGPFRTRDDATAALRRLHELPGHDEAQVIESPQTPPS